MENEIENIWENLIKHFNAIKCGLKAIKILRDGELSSNDHQMTIEEIIKNIYEEM